ncbi:DUF504 domain-containing protein [Methanopyrus sp. SNP6]|uniref:DUF504 domain-containing protein n=1 Tax=Methanopyrus sp. SNP6 TaxID=1937005 RepID=UPI0011E5C42E|nr:DUF504 domain-containing protein [Methanopyrus sp. SNP6]
MSRKTELEEIFSRMLHDPDDDPSEYVIYVIDRGSSSGLRRIWGDEIQDVKRGFLVLWNAEIPVHRVIRVERGGRVIWERGRRARGRR